MMRVAIAAVFLPLLSCTSSADGVLPDACAEVEYPFRERACTKALEEYCASEGDEAGCGERSDLRVLDSSVRCVWGNTATITDEQTCSMTAGGQCYAVLISNTGSECYDYCDADTSNRSLFLVDNVLIRLPCQSGVDWSGPIIEETADWSAENPVQYRCAADDPSPDSPLCNCAAAACDVLD